MLIPATVNLGGVAFATCGNSALGYAVTAAQVGMLLTSHAHEASSPTPYSKHAQSSSSGTGGDAAVAAPLPAASTAAATMVPSRYGMLLIYMPSTLVGATMLATEPKLATALLLAHFGKRTAESAWLHRYSGGMPLAVAGFISAYYSLVTFAVSRVAVGGDGPAASLAAVALFAVGSAGNLAHHAILARARTPPAEKKKSDGDGAAAGGRYVLPRGGLFELVSAPHYLFELVAWLGVALAAQHVNALLVFGTMSSYLSGRAVATTKWNRARFGAAWPASRRHLIPFVF